MAIKYPENTSYNLSASQNLPALIKAAQLKAASNLTAPSTGVIRVGEASPTANLDPALSVSNMSSFINTGNILGPALSPGTTISQYKNLTGEPYTFQNLNKDYLIQGKYLSPSQVTEQAKFQAMPETLGGGQYIIEPTQPGAAVKTERPNSWKEREIERQGLDPALYQIDHLIPLWAGGDDTLANKEILDNIEHQKKTDIQAVPLTLLSHGLISQREAMEMALTWRDKAQRDDVTIPTSSTDIIPLKDAIRIAKQWGQTPSVTWKSFLQSIPGAQQKVYGVGSEIVNEILPKNKLTAIPREFAKGVLGGIGFDIGLPQLDVSADYNDKAANTTGAVSHFLGALTGNLLLFGKAYKLALQGLSKAGAKWATAELVGKTTEDLAKSDLIRGVIAKGISPEVATNLLKDVTPTGIAKISDEIFGKKITEGLLKKIAEDTVAKEAAAKVAATGAQEVIETGVKAGAKVIPKEILGKDVSEQSLKNLIAEFAGREATTAEGKAALKVSGTISKAVKFVLPTAKGELPKALTLGGVSAGLGQIRPVTSEDRAERAALDFAMGFFTPVGRAAYSVKGYASVAAPALFISAMEGLTPGNSFANAIATMLINTGTMVGMHGMGQLGGAYKMAGGDLSKVWGGLLTAPREAPSGMEAYWTRDTGYKPGDILEKQTHEYSMKTAVTGSALDKKATTLQKLQYEKNLQIASRNLASKNLEMKYGELNDAVKLGTFTNKDFGVTPEEWRSIKDSFQYRRTSKPAELERQVAILDKFLKWQKTQKGWSDDTLFKERGKIAFAGRELYKSGLPQILRNRADVEDLLSFVKHIENPDPTLVYKPDGIKYLEYNTDISERTAEPTLDSLTLNPANPETNFRAAIESPSQDSGTILKTKIAKGINNKSIPSLQVTINGESKFGINALASKEVRNGKEQITMYIPQNGKYFEVGKVSEPESTRMKNMMKDQAGGQGVNLAKAAIIYDPAAEVPTTGEHAVFIDARVNDLTWDGPTNKKLAEKTQEKPGVVAQKISDTLKNKPVVTPEAPIEAPKVEAPIVAPKVEAPIEAPKVEAPIVAPKVEVAKVEAPVEVKAEQPVLPFTKEVEPIKSNIAEENINAKFVSAKPIKEGEPDFRAATTIKESEIPDSVDSPAVREEKVSALNFRKMDQKIIEGFPEDLDLQFKDKGITKDSPEAKQAIQYLRKFREDALPAEGDLPAQKSLADRAKEEVANHGGDEQAAYEAVAAKISSDFKAMGLKSPLTDRNNYQAFKSLFLKNAQSIPYDTLKLGRRSEEIKEGIPKAANYLNGNLDRLNKANKTNLRLLKVETDKSFKKRFMKKNELADLLAAKGYVMFGFSGNKVNNAFGVKFDKFYARGKSIDDLGAKQEFFNRIIDELGIDRTEVKMDVLNKRWKEVLFDEYKPVNDPKIRKRLIIIDFGKTPDGHEVVDGGTFALYKTFKEIRDNGGLLLSDADHTTNKSMAIWKDKINNLNILKHQMFKVDIAGPQAKKIEEYVRKYIPDYKIGQDDIITSYKNIKVGKDILSNFSAGKKNFYVSDIGMDSFRSKYDLPKNKSLEWDEENSRFSPYLWSKLSHIDGLNDSVFRLYEVPMKRFNESFKKLMGTEDGKIPGAKSPEEARAILDEYSDIYQGSLGEEVYGKTKKIMATGGWGKQANDVRHEMNQTFSKALREYIINGRFLKSNYGKFLPDIGQLGHWVPEDSIVLSDKTIKNLGNPEEVLVTRHPNTRRSGMVALKVINAKDYNIRDLGDSMIINNKLGYTDLSFDTDGDAGPIYAIGKSTDKEFRIPQEVANKFKQIYATEGGKPAKKLENYGDYLERTGQSKLNDIGLDNSINIGWKSVKGGDSVAENSNMRSAIQGVIDNNESIGGWTLKPPAAGQNVEARNQEMFAYFDYMNQASTDAVKAVDLSNELAKYKVDNLSDLIKARYFNPPPDVGIKAADRAFTSRMFELRLPYGLAKEKSISNFNDYSDRLFGRAADLETKTPAIEGYQQKVLDKRTVLEPVDQMLLAIKDNMPVFPKQFSKELQQRQHDVRMEAVDKFKIDNPEKFASATDPKVKTFVNYFTKTKDDLVLKIEARTAELEKEVKDINETEEPHRAQYSTDQAERDYNDDIRELKNTTRMAIEDEYNQYQTDLTEDQRRTISYWILKSKKANWSNMGKKIIGDELVDTENRRVSFQFRLANIFTNTPDVAEIYFRAKPKSLEKTTTKKIPGIKDMPPLPPEEEI